MKSAIAVACAATFSIGTFALADSVTVDTDPEPTSSVVIQERQDPDLIIKQKKKVVIKEESDPDVTIKGTVEVD